MSETIETSIADPLEFAALWLSEDRKVALATVINTWGSSPRAEGSHLVIDGEGNFEGSVSGGCVETEVIIAAAHTIETGLPSILEFQVSNETAWGAGLSCGGKIRVFVQQLTDLVELQRLNLARRQRMPCKQVIDLVRYQSKFVHEIDTQHSRLCASGIDTFEHDRSAFTSGARNQEFFINDYDAAIRLYIVGAVHITKALIPIARALNWQCVVIDPRSAFASTERFPGVTLFPEWPQDAFKSIQLDRHTALIALCHAPHIDDVAIAEALDKSCFYVGALGSKRTHKNRLERLTALGIPAGLLQKIRAPIGLPIGALGPEEIALSIVAQIVSVLRLSSEEHE